MKLIRQIFFLTSYIIITIPILGQGVYFNNLYDNFYNTSNVGYSVITKNGKYIVGGNGYASCDSSNGSSIDLFSIDNFGNLEWIKTYNHYNFILSNDQYSILISTPDSGYAFFNNETQNCIACFPSCELDSWFLKLNNNADSLMSKLFNYYFVIDIISSEENAFVVLFSNTACVKLLGLDSLGNWVWGDTLSCYGDSAYNEIAFSVEKTIDDGYMILGAALDTAYDSLFGPNLYIGHYVVKADSLGILQWDTIITDSTFIGVRRALKTNDGNYIFYGSKILKLDSVLNIIWTKPYTESFKELIQLPDSSFVGIGSSSAFLMKLNKDGDSLWTRYFSGNRFNDIQQTADGGFIITGESNSDMWLVKTNCLGYDALPQADFVYAVSDTTTYVFTNQSNNASDYTWFFGDGDTSASKNPIHTYLDTGSYIVILMAIACGDTGIFSDTVIIVDCALIKPLIYIEADTFFIADTIQFYDSSTLASQWYWDFGDSSTDTNQHPVHIYDSAGTYIVMLVSSYSICSDTAYGTVIVSDFTGISDKIFKNNFHIYPNPGKNILTIKIKSINTNEIIIKIFNIQGKEIFTDIVKKYSGDYIKELNISKFNKGLYTVQVIIGDEIITRKIIID